MIRSLHQPPDSASISVRRSASVGQDVSLLYEQCEPILLCVWGSDVSVTEVLYEGHLKRNAQNAIPTEHQMSGKVL